MYAENQAKIAKNLPECGFLYKSLHTDCALTPMKNIATMRMLKSASAKQFSWTPLG